MACSQNRLERDANRTLESEQPNGAALFVGVATNRKLIRLAPPPQQAELEALAPRIVAAVAQKADVQALEAEVNARVYRLFGLTRAEIALIEET